MQFEFCALFEHECAPVAQRIRAADFGLSRPMRCSSERGRGSESVELSALLRVPFGSPRTATLVGEGEDLAGDPEPPPRRLPDDPFRES
jgi:hypothetical protein